MRARRSRVDLEEEDSLGVSVGRLGHRADRQHACERVRARFLAQVGAAGAGAAAFVEAAWMSENSKEAEWMSTTVGDVSAAARQPRGGRS
eukprot:2779905-Pleurochrysis_carterae.AAC.2